MERDSCLVAGSYVGALPVTSAWRFDGGPSLLVLKLKKSMLGTGKVALWEDRPDSYAVAGGP
jgi:hypothetical protein